MSRLDFLTIFIVAICLGALGYLVYKTVQLMNPPGTADRSIEDSYNLRDDAMEWQDSLGAAAADDTELGLGAAGSEDADDQAATISDPEGALSRTPASSSTSARTTQPRTDVATPAENTQPARSSTSSTSTRSTTTTAPATASTSSTGRYAVVAGAFGQRANADREAQRIRKLGYANAEVSTSGQYAVVVVNRYRSLGDAEALVRELAAKNIKAFVKVRQ